MLVAFYTLGCKVNQYETEILKGIFANGGYTIASPEDYADVYVINSCTVTAESDKKTRKIMRAFRRKNPSAVIALTGCMPQANNDDSLWPEADVVTGSKDRAGLVKLVEQAITTGMRVVDIKPHVKGEKFEDMRLLDIADKTRAFVKVQDGCNRYCTYCIIPTARGPLRSKPLEDITAEVTGLGQKGFKEVVLVGINLSLYGFDSGKKLVDAVYAAAAAPLIERVRLGSLEPELLTPADIEALAGVDKLCMQFHMSLQSGCDATLKRMRRHYTTAEFLEIATALRKNWPDAAITTDIIVGFPGETEEEFEQTLEFAQKADFSKIHVFSYSVRPGTKAADMPNKVDGKIIAERAKKLAELAAQTEEKFYKMQIGKIYDVLFENPPAPGICTGHTSNYIPVVVESPADLKGQICSVKITKVVNGTAHGILMA